MAKKKANNLKLIIVESPSKAKTISKYLDGEYEVRASVGHIRDLPKSNKRAIDIEGGFIPHYEVAKGKEKVVEEIKELASRASEVLLATDPDREGEAIAWHVEEACGLKGAKRIVFHEITEEAVKEAIKHPREIDMNLRRAQEARRVLDRLVGYDLSGLIWKKVRYGLSAGRVQSPALRIIMEREREIRAFVPEQFWRLSAIFKTRRDELLTLQCEEEPRAKEEVERILSVGKAGKWNVKDLKETEMNRSPRPPFTTSTLQQTASSRLGFAPSRTMGIAQKLYEKGFITYMRTDSLTIAASAQAEILKEITGRYGEGYAEARLYKAKSKNAQEAHEAVRPTSARRETIQGSEEEKRLYRLIWGRTMASQMADAKIKNMKLRANVAEDSIPDFSVTGSRLLYDGWLKADPDGRGEDVELPKVEIGEALRLKDISAEEKATEPPPRYTEAGLIKELEKRDIGRPSTYASIIKTIQDRGYVEKVNKALMPTDTGDVVSSFLESNFANYISDTFTAEMEDELDEIAVGKRDYTKTLKDFYKPFLKDVKSKEKIDKLTTLGDAPEGVKCPKCGGDMVVKLGRSGKFLSCARFPDCIGARTIDGKELEGPKETGEACPECKDGKLVERDGRFGRFIACSNYPKCKHIKKSEEEEKRGDTGIICTLCKSGTMRERRGRFGVFYSCSDYPKCKLAIKAKPTGKHCEICKALMMEGTKTIPERCSDKNCKNHNPHKAKIS
ncbi:type I DNA topoisomerase [Candidatus Parcubacteria bacterium]|nr:type I DNA topoisomerase [Candidatus Parcubacteria bacterium]